jgi:hypothetical protein
MNSREKGKRGERAWRDELRAQGFQARRGQQFSGSPDSPDVVCDSLPWIHFEVKAVERLNIEDAMEQARADARVKSAKCRVESAGPGGSQLSVWNSQLPKVPIVAHKRSFRRWLVTMDAEDFFRLLRGDFTGANGGNGEGTAEYAECAEGKERIWQGALKGLSALPKTETTTTRKNTDESST